MIKTWKAPAELSTVPGTWQVLRKYQLSPTRSFHAVHSILDSQPHAPDAFSLPAPYSNQVSGPVVPPAPVFPTCPPFRPLHCCMRKFLSALRSWRMEFYLPRGGGWSESLTDKVILKQFQKKYSLPTKTRKGACR